MGDLLSLKLWSVVVIISLVGVLTKLVYFRIGQRGKNAILNHIPHMEPDQLQAIEDRYARNGRRLLLLASVPGVGPPIAAAAGLLQTSTVTFIVLVLISNLIRNILLVLIFDQGIDLFAGS